MVGFDGASSPQAYVAGEKRVRRYETNRLDVGELLEGVHVVMVVRTSSCFVRMNFNSVYESRHRDGIRLAVRLRVVIFFFFCDRDLTVVVIMLKETQKLFAIYNSKQPAQEQKMP